MEHEKKMIKNFQFHTVQKTTLMEYTYSFCCCCGGHIKKLKAHITRYIKCPAELLTDVMNILMVDPNPPQHNTRTIPILGRQLYTSTRAHGRR